MSNDDRLPQTMTEDEVWDLLLARKHPRLVAALKEEHVKGFSEAVTHMRNGKSVTRNCCIPHPGETAAAAKERGCNVSDMTKPDAEALFVVDFYPRRYAWSVVWSDGTSSGVRSDETDELKEKFFKSKFK